MNCSKCGAEVSETDAFCGACGSPVTAGATPPAAPPPEAPPPTATPTGAPAAPPPPPQYGAGPQYGAPQYGAAPPPPYGGYGPVRFQDPISGAPTAEWWQRAVALIIDWLIVGIPGIILIVAVSAATATTTVGPLGNSVTTHSAAATTFTYIVLIAAYALYYILLNGSERGQTVGKMAMGIATRDESGQSSIGYGRAAGRFGIVFVCGFCFIPELLNYLWPLWDPRRQAWHDKVAHSLVVNIR